MDLDGGVQDVGSGACPLGSEGCPCSSSFAPTDTAFQQDDCDPGLLCVPWDRLSGRRDLTGPVQTCVRPCLRDVECGGERSCGSIGFPASSGAGSICRDEVAGADEFCGGSRSTVSRVPGVSIETPGRIVGCPRGASCLIATFQDLHVDEGICLGLCGGDQDCGGETPYCNPRMFTTTSSRGSARDVGVCSVGKLGPGAVCGAEAPKLGLAARCDTAEDAPELTCVRVGGLFPAGQGFCAQSCNAQRPCVGSEPGLGATSCAPGFFTNGDGICASGCNNFPDDCAGDGALGFGRVCMSYLSDGRGDPVGLCVDRQGPALTPARVDEGGDIVDPGDACFGTEASLDFLRCPPGSHCELDFASSSGQCLYGCTMGGSCEALGAGAQCVEAFERNGRPVTDVGACTGGAPDQR